MNTKGRSSVTTPNSPWLLYTVNQEVRSEALKIAAWTSWLSMNIEMSQSHIRQDIYQLALSRVYLISLKHSHCDYADSDLSKLQVLF